MTLWINVGVIVLFLVVGYMAVRTSDRRRDRWPVTPEEKQRLIAFDARAEELATEILSQQFGAVRVRVKQHKLGDMDPRHLTVDGMVDAYRERLANEFPDVPSTVRIPRQLAFEDTVIAQIKPPVGSMEAAEAIQQAFENYSEERERDARRKAIRSIPRWVIKFFLGVLAFVLVNGTFGILLSFLYPEVLGIQLSTLIGLIVWGALLTGLVKSLEALNRWAQSHPEASFMRYMYDIQDEPEQDHELS